MTRRHATLTNKYNERIPKQFHEQKTRRLKRGEIGPIERTAVGLAVRFSASTMKSGYESIDTKIVLPQ